MASYRIRNVSLPSRDVPAHLKNCCVEFVGQAQGIPARKRSTHSAIETEPNGRERGADWTVCAIGKIMKTDGVILASANAAEAPWSTLIPADQWVTFRLGAGALDAITTPFLLHGAMALATYTGHWRNTKDVDVIVRPRDHVHAIEALRAAGFDDYFEQLPYDRSWIFRAFKDGTLFDVIWALPNHRVEIDNEWFERARPLRLRGGLYAAVGPEELIRVKLYVMQRERCDWVDVLNVMAAVTEDIDWRWLVERMGRDVALLHGALAVFNWLCPGRAEALPAWLRERFALPAVDPDDWGGMEERRVRLFDSRPWFALHQPLDRPLER